jgi:hypothetical protein
METKSYLPFEGKFLDSIGRGQDNVVAPISSDPDVVVKWNHDYKESSLSPKYVYDRVLYKKRKYEMLKLFLPEFIPKTNFIVGNKGDGFKIKMKEYTIQERVPQVTISQLTQEELSNERFRYNLYLLLLKLSNIYDVVNYVNSYVEVDGKIDVRLDLGGLSRSAEEKELPNYGDFNLEFIDNKNFCKSPNLLVDPSTYNIYCIDFGRGIWNDKKEEAYEKVLDLSKSENIKQIIDLSNPYSDMPI